MTTDTQGISLSPGPPSIALWLSRVGESNVIVRYAALSNGAILLCLLWMLVVPDSGLGLLQFVVNDTGLRRNTVIALFMALFFMDIAQALRGVVPTWSYLTTLSGQGAFAVLGAIYTLQGSVGLVGFYTHVGPFLLSFIGILVAIQRARLHPPWFVPHWMRENTKRVMLTTLSFLLFVLAWGLLTRPDTNIGTFIQTRYGLGAFVVMIGVMLWGAGQLRHNHMKPWQALRRTFGIWLFSFMSLYLLATDNEAIAPLSVYLSLSVALLSALFAIVQSYDERTA